MIEARQPELGQQGGEERLREELVLGERATVQEAEAVGEERSLELDAESVALGGGHALWERGRGETQWPGWCYGCLTHLHARECRRAVVRSVTRWTGWPAQCVSGCGGESVAGAQGRRGRRETLALRRAALSRTIRASGSTSAPLGKADGQRVGTSCAALCLSA